MRPAAAQPQRSGHHTHGLRASLSQQRGSAVRGGDPQSLHALFPHDGAHEAARPVPGGRLDAPRGGRADGRDLGSLCGPGDRKGPGFDAPVAPGGYQWWYLDVLSDDGRTALTAIVFIGSVFSPAYRRAREAAKRRGEASPAAERFAAVNLAIYGAESGQSRWILSEYADGLERSPDGLSLHRSRIEWQGDCLVLEIDDVEPWTQRRVSGRIRIDAGRRFAPAIDLADNGQHHWYPVAPASRASVEFERPDLRFEGIAYHDMNQGQRALEDDFVGRRVEQRVLRSARSVNLDIASRRAVTEGKLGVRRSGNKLKLRRVKGERPVGAADSIAKTQLRIVG